MRKTNGKMNLMYKSFKVVVVLLLVYVIGTLLFENVAFLNRYQHYVIVSDSMTPTIGVGDVVVIDKGIDLATLRPGDIIAFDVTINNQDVVVVHYLEGITSTAEGYEITTIAEGATSSDAWVLSAEDVIGIHWFTVPFVGRILLFAGSPVGRLVILIDIILIYVLYRIFFKKD